MMQTLLADIGGTTTRLAVTGPGGRPERVFSIENDAVASLSAAIRRYMESNRVVPTMAVLALAAPVEQREIVLTNRAWRIRLDDLAAEFGFSSVHAINDFEALAWALPVLRADDLRVLGPAVDGGRGPKLVLGPGTGLGVAALVPSGEGWIAVASEGGHISFGARSPEEAAMFARLPDQSTVSAETLISGPGLERIYRALHPDLPPLAASAIDAGARAGQPAARAAVDLFVRMLGRFAGDAALMFKATGGVYIAGGVAMRLGPLLDTSMFRATFEAHPPYQRLLAGIPTWLVACPEPALIGCAVVAARLRGQPSP
jgi:glucokinase